MSSITRRSSISSDWEDLDAISGGDSIYDDTASILSLSSTLSDSEGSDDSDEPPSVVQTRASTQPVALPTREKSTKPRERVDHDADSVASDDTITEDLLDVVVEPPVLLSNLASLQSSLSEIIPSCKDQDSADTHGAVSGVLEALHRLLGTIIDLKEVVAGYVKTYIPNDPFSTAPQLDPLLYKWCTTCALKLYKLQADKQLAARSQQYSKCMGKLCDDLSVFLPILRVDLDEYQTPQLDFPNYPVDEPPSYYSNLHRRYRNTDLEPVVDGPIPDLRRRLYALKDEIGRANTVISDCLVTKTFSRDTRAQLREIQALQTRTFETFGILLSNHGSDWIEQTIAGGLSYAEFTNLDRKDIQAFAERISKFGSLLDDLRFWTYTSSDAGSVKPRQRLSLGEQSYDGAQDTSKEDELEFVPAALDCQGFKATLVELNSMLKVEVEVEVEVEKD